MSEGNVPAHGPNYVDYNNAQGVIVSSGSPVYASATPVTNENPRVTNPCRVYWGSHGCDFERGHDGYCRCHCADWPPNPNPNVINVGAYPYYGDGTLFYGEDAVAKWGAHRVHSEELP